MKLSMFGNLCNSPNLCFPNEWDMMLSNHTWVKDPFQVQGRPIELTMTVWKVSDFTV